MTTKKPPKSTTLKRLYVTREDIQAELKKLKKGRTGDEISQRQISVGKRTFIKRNPTKNDSLSRKDYISPMKSNFTTKKVFPQSRKLYESSLSSPAKFNLTATPLAHDQY